MAWVAVRLLGAYHGINPGMGWLFAVALGMQDSSARGVWRALPPIALGHGLEIAVASILIAFGLYRLWRHRHPRFGGMQVGFRDLTIWPFLMASAHGAGFMVLPLVMGAAADAQAAGAGRAHTHAVASEVAAWPPWACVLVATGVIVLVV